MMSFHIKRFAKISLQLMILTCVYSFTRCTNPIASDDAEQISIIYPKYVRINDSTKITVHTDLINLEHLYLQWHVSSGKFKDGNKEIIYYSPDSVTSTQIELFILNQSKIIKKYSFSISIYKQLIILKADDLRNDPVSSISYNWKRFTDYIIAENIKASLGLIGNSLEKGDYNYLKFVRNIASSVSFELWNHGYNHVINAQYPNFEYYDEFQNTSLEYQLEHLKMTQNLAKEKLGITIRAFGAPGNATDENTARALNDIGDIQIIFYKPVMSGKIITLAVGNSKFEFPTGNPDYSKFLIDYKPDYEYLVFQLHPNKWNETQFEQFKLAISYLKNQATTFILPSEYYEMLNIKKLFE